MNENSKVIIVDGNLAVGKNDFGRRLAKNFDLKFFPSVTDTDVYTVKENGFDQRSLNVMLPERAQFYTLERWLSEADPKVGTVGRLQILWMKEKFEQYCRALHHLFHTGQGVVIVRSVQSDHVLVEAMRRCGFLTPQFMKYYYDVRDNAVCELLKPHLTIYLDAPNDTIKQRIKSRNNPLEQNSKVITDQFISNINSLYRDNFLPKMRQTGAVLEVDWSEVADDDDMDVISEEIERIHLECEDVEDAKFREWYKVSEDMLCHYRKIYGDKKQIEQLFSRGVAMDCPEINYNPDDIILIERVVENHPAIRYEPGWAPELGHRPAFKLF